MLPLMPTLPMWPTTFLAASTQQSPSTVANIHNRYLIVEGGVRRTVSEREFYEAMPACSHIDVERFPRDPYVTNLCYL